MMVESKRILIAEDDPSTRKTLCELVSRWGFSAAEAGDSLQVRESLRSYQPDILLMDIDAPTLEGPTVLDEIKHRRLPVTAVLITSENGATDQTRSNADDLLEKPVEPTALRSVLTRICERQATSTEQVGAQSGSQTASAERQKALAPTPSLNNRAWTWPTFEVRVGTKLEEVEYDLITHTIAAVKGNKTRAAAMLGISLRTLYNRLARYRANHKP
jgi:DNA-binding NtrC family response regulator